MLDRSVQRPAADPVQVGGGHAGGPAHAGGTVQVDAGARPDQFVQQAYRFWKMCCQIDWIAVSDGHPVRLDSLGGVPSFVVLPPASEAEQVVVRLQAEDRSDAFVGQDPDVAWPGRERTDQQLWQRLAVVHRWIALVQLYMPRRPSIMTDMPAGRFRL